MKTKQKKVIFIIPPSLFLLDERVFMHLGVLKIGAFLESQGIPVGVLDLSGIENYKSVVVDYLATHNPDIIGITATTPQLPAVERIRSFIREKRPSIKIVLGGPHVSLVNAAARREKKNLVFGRATKSLSELESLFDVLVAGDGEFSMLEVIKNDLFGIVDADASSSPFFLTNEMLEATPWPNRDLIAIDTYKYTIDGERALSLIAQLGCPFSCGFCGGRNSPFLRHIRTRSIENIIAEVRFLHEKYGVRGFMFYDDELNVNKSIVALMNKLTDLQSELGIAFKLRGFVKSELFTEEQAVAMYRAGFRWILVGFESGSEKILKNINKKATREDNTRCMDIATTHNLKVKALMSVGHPGESEETMFATRNWLIEVQPDDFDVTTITVYPGTPYYDDAVPHQTEKDVWVYTYKGDNLYSYEINYLITADYYKGDPNGGYKSFVYTDYLRAEEIVALRDFIEKDIRKKLNIPFNPGSPSRRYEHSMGQGGKFPDFIFKE